MSTNQTPNYALSQWEAGDQVLRADFNADNAKIDAALAELAAGQHRIFMGSYRGVGGDTLTLELPFRPIFLYIQRMDLTDTRFVLMGDKGALTYWLTDTKEPWTRNIGNGYYVTVTGGTVEFNFPSDIPPKVLTQSNCQYMYIAIG